jgi:hypothetical protein
MNETQLAVYRLSHLALGHISLWLGCPLVGYSAAWSRRLRVLTAKTGGAPSDVDDRVTKLPSMNHKVPIIRRSDAMHL